jgi:hypothetical protein
VRSIKTNIDQLQRKQAESEKEIADGVVPRTIRDTYKWLLCPMQDRPSDPVTVEPHPLTTSAATLIGEVERVCRENELVIATWSPVHLRTRLLELYWTNGRVAASAMAFWEDTLRYVYLPRLRKQEVLAAAIKEGAGKRDYFGTAHGQSGESDGRFEGFGFGDDNVQLSDTLLLVAPVAAAAFEARVAAEREATRLEEATAADKKRAGDGGVQPELPVGPTGGTVKGKDPATVAPVAKPAVMRSYHGMAEVNAASAKLGLGKLADELIAVLTSDPHAVVRVTVEIAAEFPHGAPEHVRRAASENGKTLGLKVSEWE